MRPRPLLLSLPALVVAGLALSAGPSALVYDVRDFGAKGDGRTLDTPAITAAIEAAAAAGGGTVYLPAGTYPSYSIRLKSHITLQLGAGATLLAAEPSPQQGRYDAPEPNEHDIYQDFGHSHWQNSLIWGIGLEDVEILGPGRIDGAGLTRRGPGARWSRAASDRPVSMGAAAGRSGDPEAAARQAMDGQGNKAIALKLCRNVRLRGFSILNGGHFAILATGVDNLTIDNLTIDTNRDGIDLDACRHVRVSNTAVNSPNDDAIVLKSSYALGVARATENVTVSDVDPRYPALIAGLAGHPVEDVDLANIHMLYRGGGTREDAAREPPENEAAYPEPSMFGTLPAYGFYLRHARNVTLRDVEVGFTKEDLRPAFALHDVTDVHFDHVRARLAPGVPFGLFRDVRGLSGHDSPGLPEIRREPAKKKEPTP